jgi:hypothetical protein
MAKLAIFKYFNIEEGELWGAIDGQKIEAQIETFNARNSSKYFGPRKGVSSITLVINHIPVNARIISSHDHEGVHTRSLQELALTYYTHNCSWDSPGVFCV